MARIIGICRFSFLGRGDWIGMRGPGAMDRLVTHSATLYAGTRMARRFAAFEALLLPSICAQSDGDFALWIVTSPELPAIWLDRLRAACAGVPQIRILISDARSVDEALAEPLTLAAQDGPVTQFRIDDDDALGQHYIARLRAHMARLADLPEYAISLASGLILRRYAGEGLSHWRALQRFGSAGAAVRMGDPARSIYAVNHFDLPRNLPAFSDVSGLNYLQLRWDQGDSAIPARENWDHRHVQLTPAAFADCLREDFPFLDGADPGFLTVAGQ